MFFRAIFRISYLDVFWRFKGEVIFIRFYLILIFYLDTLMAACVYAVYFRQGLAMLSSN